MDVVLVELVEGCCSESGEDTIELVKLVMVKKTIVFSSRDWLLGIGFTNYMCTSTISSVKGIKECVKGTPGSN